MYRGGQLRDISDVSEVGVNAIRHHSSSVPQLTMTAGSPYSADFVYFSKVM